MSATNKIDSFAELRGEILVGLAGLKTKLDSIKLKIKLNVKNKSNIEGLLTKDE